MKAIIIGNGIAGISVATELRKKEADNAKLSIDVYTDEEYSYYARLRLPEFTAGNIPESVLYLNKPEWYEKNAITVHTSSPLYSINRQNKTITVANNTQVPYDVLILATGAHANSTTIQGSTAQGIYTLRTLSDAQKIKQRIASYPDSAAVIGGGLLGLEAARALKTAGLANVTVIEIASRLLPRQLDEQASTLLQRYLEYNGLSILTGSVVDHFITDGDSVTGIATKSGNTISAHTVIASMGVSSNTQAAKEAGLQVNRGIIVDTHMQTTDTAIFACGDCAEFSGIVWGLLTVAIEQAPLAAKNAYAFLNKQEQQALYTQTVPKTTLKIAGLDVLSMGKAVLNAEEATSGTYIEYHHSTNDQNTPRYEKLVIQNNVLIGAILFGTKEHQTLISSLLNKTITQEQIESILHF